MKNKFQAALSLRNIAFGVKEEKRQEKSPDEFVTDVLVELRIYCDMQELDFGKLDQRAHQHYLHEAEGCR